MEGEELKHPLNLLTLLSCDRFLCGQTLRLLSRSYHLSEEVKDIVQFSFRSPAPLAASGCFGPFEGVFQASGRKIVSSGRNYI